MGPLLVMGRLMMVAMVAGVLRGAHQWLRFHGKMGVEAAKQNLAPLAADASPLDLGDWLAVCGPVLRDLSAVSARWWNLTLREAQCYYDRWKLASPLERVQIDPRLPDELLDLRYQRTQQRGVHLLLQSNSK